MTSPYYDPHQSSEPPDGPAAEFPPAGTSEQPVPAGTSEEFAPGPGAGVPGAAEEIEWHRVHRVTPLLNAWKVAAALFAIFIWQYNDTLGHLDLPITKILLIVLGVIVLGSLIGLGLSTLSWSRTSYGLSEESVFLHSGVIFRQQRHVRLDRMQTVDVTQPLLARITGFAALKIESAGGSGSNLTLAFLKEDTAQQLRNDLLARAAGLRTGRTGRGHQAGVAGAADRPGGASGEGGPSEAGPALAPAAPEREVLTLAPARLIGSLALSIGIVLISLFLIALVVAVIISGNIGPIFAVGAPVLGGAAYWWGRFAGEFSFRVATSPDGVRVRQGLLETKARTIPPGRVQAVQLAQPPMWRIKGWWRITVNIAGYGPEETTGTVLYPVATEAEAAQMLYLVQPNLGAEHPLDLLHAGLIGSGDDQGFVTSPRRARWLDPLIWRRNGFRVTETVTLLRTGRWWRTLKLVPHERVQSLNMAQGPLARKLDLAGVALHSTPGPITPGLGNLDLAITRELLLDLTEHARKARHSAGPERWMEGGGEATGRAPFSGTDPADPAGAPGEAAGVPADLARTSADPARTAVDPAATRASYGGILPTPGARE